MPLTVPRPSSVQRKVGGGVGPLITSSKEHSPPRGKFTAALFSSMKKIIMTIFFSPWLDNNIPPVGGKRAHHLSVAEEFSIAGQERAPSYAHAFFFLFVFLL